MKKRLTLLAAAVLVAGLSSMAPAAVTYTYLKTLDFAPHPTFSRMTTATAGPAGSIYFTDNGSDHIGYFADITAVSATGGTAAVGDAEDVGISGGGFTSGNSHRGITYDGTNVYSGGLDGPSAAQLIQISGTSPSWTITAITLPPSVAFSGYAAVGTNKLAAADSNTGAMNILTVSGGSATVDGTVAGGGVRTNQVAADIAHSKIFASIASANNAGPVQVFTSDGTVAGTSYSGAANPVVAAVASSFSLTSTGLNYQTVSVDSSDQVICLGQNLGSSGQSSWQLYDVSAGGTNLTPYQTIDGATTPDGVISASESCLGSVFFTQGGIKYLALGRSSGKVYVFRDSTASVPNWEMF
ncbi:hypothetical protein IT570_07820 [Candidatus Sumerlaeota bacterium]|nr:hypothetical protein [Candidatus Sumerlaeota bacterium]